jgi:hypothetical protein
LETVSKGTCRENLLPDLPRRRSLPQGVSDGYSCQQGCRFCHFLSPPSPPTPPRRRGSTKPTMPGLRPHRRRLAFGRSSGPGGRSSREQTQPGRTQQSPSALTTPANPPGDGRCHFRGSPWLRIGCLSLIATDENCQPRCRLTGRSAWPADFWLGPHLRYLVDIICLKNRSAESPAGGPIWRSSCGDFTWFWFNTRQDRL